MMEVQHHSRISLLLVAVYCGQFTHFDMKHKGPLVFESSGNNRKSEVNPIYKNNAILCNASSNNNNSTHFQLTSPFN